MLTQKEQFAATINATRIALRKSTRKKLPKPPIPPHPLNEERLYRKFLIGIINFFEQKVKALLIPQLPRLVGQAGKFKPVTDDFTDDLDNIMQSITHSLDGQVDEDQIARHMSGGVLSFQSKWFQRTIKKVLGVDILVNQPWLRDHLNAWIATNADLIKNLQDKALHDVKFQVQNGFTQGLRHEEIAKNIIQRIDVTKSRANLIARDQTSKLNGQLNQLKQQQIGITHYTWQTAMDERVRPSHAIKQGRVFSWDNPPADTGHPGEDINCRCIALPVFEDELFS